MSWKTILVPTLALALALGFIVDIERILKVNSEAQPERVFLVQNYRNPSDILDFASETIDMCSEKLSKTLNPRDEDHGTDLSPLIFQRVISGNEYDFRDKQNRAALRIIQDLVLCSASSALQVNLRNHKKGKKRSTNGCKKHIRKNKRKR